MIVSPMKNHHIANTANPSNPSNMALSSVSVLSFIGRNPLGHECGKTLTFTDG